MLPTVDICTTNHHWLMPKPKLAFYILMIWNFEVLFFPYAFMVGLLQLNVTLRHIHLYIYNNMYVDTLIYEAFNIEEILYVYLFFFCKSVVWGWIQSNCQLETAMENLIIGPVLFENSVCYYHVSPNLSKNGYRMKKLRVEKLWSGCLSGFVKTLITIGSHVKIYTL